MARLAVGTPASPELFEFIARKNNEFVFGRLEVRDGSSAGSVDVLFECNLPADSLRKDDLIWVLGNFIGGSDRYDTLIVENFGGSTVHDDY